MQMKTVVANIVPDANLCGKEFGDVLARYNYNVEDRHVINYILKVAKKGVSAGDLAQICAREAPAGIEGIQYDLGQKMPRKYFKRFSTKLRLILHPNPGFEMVMPHAESEAGTNRFDAGVFVDMLCARDFALRGRIAAVKKCDVRGLAEGLLHDGVMPDEVITARIFACLILKFGKELKAAASARFLRETFGTGAARLLQCGYCAENFCKSCANCKIRTD